MTLIKERQECNMTLQQSINVKEIASLIFFQQSAPLASLSVSGSIFDYTSKEFSILIYNFIEQT